MPTKALSVEELNFVDGVLNLYEYEDLENFKIKLELAKKEDWFSEETFNSLRMCGVIITKIIQNKRSVVEGHLETIIDEDIIFLKIDTLRFVEIWFETFVFRLGPKREIKLNSITPKTDLGFILLNLSLGESTDSLDVKIITNTKIKDLEGILVSLINFQDNKLFDIISWYEPVMTNDDASYFFGILESKNNLELSRNYIYINIPEQYDSQEIDNLKKAVAKFLEKINFIETNHSKHFRPESKEYSINEHNIINVFIKDNEKIFLLQNDKRLLLQAFKNGFKLEKDKDHNELTLLSNFINEKKEKYSKLKNKIKVGILKDIKYIFTILLPIVISLIASINIIFSSNNISLNSEVLLYIHLFFSFVIVASIIFTAVYPLLSLYFFSWNRVRDKSLKFENRSNTLKSNLN
ncbi:hypothetical protein [Shouchella miscanthi]|uniref:hypothetical protein n=1 Tax=Shouchella miscanthi TaxID=2598861 RepID=UPI0011A5C302|nr:hypothetical protein [Shouchella miscanthi]